MLESIRIKGFRKYKDFKLDGFNAINFILGDNNVGKTSILEAIYTWACGENVAPMLSIPLARGRYYLFQNQYWLMEELLTMVADRHELPLVMEFEGIYDGKSERFQHSIYPSDLLPEFDSSFKNSMDKVIPKLNDNSSDQNNVINMQLFAQPVVAKWDIKHGDNCVDVKITAPVSAIPNAKSFVPAKYIDILSHTAITENVQMYASLKREGLLGEVVDRINAIFPEIKDFDMIPYPDGSQAPVSVLKSDGTTLPLYACGDGIQRWFYIVGALTIYKNAIICIDEIDAGLHPNAQIDFCKNISEYALKNNVQLFITTHNIEFMDRYLDTVAENNSLASNVNVFTIKQNAKGLAVRKLNAKDAQNLRENNNLELR